MEMPTTVHAFVWAVAAYALWSYLSLLFTWRRQAAIARELKCEDPPFLKSKLPYGISTFIRILRAGKAKKFPVDMIQRTIDVGAITYKFQVLGSTAISTADEKNIQAILSTQFNDFDLGPVRRGSFFPLLGNGIFTQDGIPWGRSRGIIRPQFSRAQISDLDLEERHVQNMMRVLDLSINANKRTGQVDLQVLFFRLTLDTATEFLFGQSADSQIRAMPRYDGAGAENDQEADFATAFDKSQMGLAMRIRFGLKYWLYNTKEFRDSCRTCHKFVDQFVQLALSKQPKEKENMPKIEEVSTPEKYVFLEALASQTQDPIELRSQVLQLLLAGRDTTASLLGWLFFCLARDPVRFQRLRDAIIQEFGDYDKPMEITFSSLKGCNYLQYCMNETLRLYPLVPQNGRYANKDTTLPRGGGRDGNSPIFIPKGTSCTYSVHVMHHRKDIWGSDAEDFNPERWEKRKVGWDYLPFNGGPRICIGQQFALTEASYVTVRLLQRFDKIENLDTGPVQHNLTLINTSANGVNVRLHVA